MNRISPITDALPSQLMDLTNMLNFDDKLIKELGMTEGGLMTVADFVRFNATWSKKGRAEIFMILNDEEETAGMITFVKSKDGHGRCGYWVGSKHRSKGLGKEAFAEMIEVMRSKGVKFLHSTIEKNNEYSLKIWEPYSPELEDNGNYYSVTIDLSVPE